MEARAIHRRSSSSDCNLLSQQHRLRANVFADRLGWDVHVEDGEERDEYDQLDPTYIVAVRDSVQVLGCARLLPAIGPTMLEHTFPKLLASGGLHAHSAMVESSRFCVDTSSGKARELGLHRATLTMFAGIIEWSIAHGYTEIVTATDLRFERILRRAGWPLTRLGTPCAIGNTVAVAGSLPADVESFERVCPPGYYSNFHGLREYAADAAA